MRFFHLISVFFFLLGMIVGAPGAARAQGGWTDAGTTVHLTTGSDRVGIGTTAPGAKLHVTGNAMVDGRIINDTLDAPGTRTLRLRLGGRNAFRLQPTAGTPNILGGSYANEVDAGVVGATIAGGGDPDNPNVITADWGTIGGGSANHAGGDTPGNSYGSTVGGGMNNTAGQLFATVGGGHSNMAPGNSATVAGGQDNVASGLGAVVGGGKDNVASGYGAVVGGGIFNEAQGYASFAAGRRTLALGDHSFAAGSHAQALHQGAFVWADSSVQAELKSQVPHQFLIRAMGGVRVVKSWPTMTPPTAAAFHVESNAEVGEGMLLRNHDANNNYAVIKLIKAGRGDFLQCRNNVGGGEVARCHISSAGTFVAGSDFAEALPAKGGPSGYEPGDVLVLSSDREGAVEKATRAHDTRVAGVYSTRPGVLGADKDGVTRVDPDDVPVAIVGIVPTKVSAENGPIQPGDLLTTATVAGHAMKATPVVVSGVALHATGTILGKAIGSLDTGTGVIKVLVTLK